MDESVAARVAQLIENIERVVFGKHEVVKLCVTSLLARGHILIEDVPGIGKTTIAHAISRSLDLEFSRIQFTSDMLPADILGVSVLDPNSGHFEFRRGPIFANVVLADEVNRTPPKTQSALLEAMSEFQVTVEGRPNPLPNPFLVLATQNPIEYEGTYILPESQLDRFMIHVEMGYPPPEDELRIMRRRDPAKALADLAPVLTAEQLIALQGEVAKVIVDESVARYILGIVQATREHPMIQLGASPRGSLAFYEASQARAIVEGRDYVTPDDVVTMTVPVLSHRILVKARNADLTSAAVERERVLREILSRVPVPV